MTIDETIVEKPLAGMLANIQEELSQLGRDLQHLQSAISPLLQTSNRMGELLMDIQLLDTVTQHIDGLAVVMGGLASMVAPEWLVTPEHVVATLRLKGLADRLCDEALIAQPENVGDCELL